MYFVKYVALVLTVTLVAEATYANASDLSVTHPATPAPTYIDLGPPGDSPGDVRVFHFEGKTREKKTVVMEWIMTTTGIDTITGANSRVTLGIFSFKNQIEDQIVIQGVGLYPNDNDTFNPDKSLTRAIIGGTGRYAGASGVVVSTHQVDGSWSHDFRLRAPSEEKGVKRGREGR